jgi:hypothetical protein
LFLKLEACGYVLAGEVTKFFSEWGRADSMSRGGNKLDEDEWKQCP